MRRTYDASIAKPYGFTTGSECEAELIAGFAADGSGLMAHRRASGWHEVTASQWKQLLGQLAPSSISLMVAHLVFSQALADIEAKVSATTSLSTRSPDSPHPETPGRGAWQ